MRGASLGTAKLCECEGLVPDSVAWSRVMWRQTGWRETGGLITLGDEGSLSSSAVCCYRRLCWWSAWWWLCWTLVNHQNELFPKDPKYLKGYGGCFHLSSSLFPLTETRFTCSKYLKTSSVGSVLSIIFGWRSGLSCDRAPRGALGKKLKVLVT